MHEKTCEPSLANVSAADAYRLPQRVATHISGRCPRAIRPWRFSKKFGYRSLLCLFVVHPKNLQKRPSILSRNPDSKTRSYSVTFLGRSGGPGGWGSSPWGTELRRPSRTYSSSAPRVWSRWRPPPSPPPGCLGSRQAHFQG